MVAGSNPALRSNSEIPRDAEELRRKHVASDEGVQALGKTPRGGSSARPVWFLPVNFA